MLALRKEPLSRKKTGDKGEMGLSDTGGMSLRLFLRLRGQL